MTGCSIADFFALADQLPEVARADNGRYWRLAIHDRTFGYLWEPTRTVGLRFEAWRLTAARALVDSKGDRLPR